MPLVFSIARLRMSPYRNARRRENEVMLMHRGARIGAVAGFLLAARRLLPPIAISARTRAAARRAGPVTLSSHWPYGISPYTCQKRRQALILDRHHARRPALHCASVRRIEKEMAIKIAVAKQPGREARRDNSGAARL